MGDDLASKASDLVKKVLTVGVGAVFLTEESLRTLVSEFKLPKELLVQLLESANKTRQTFFQGMSEDVIHRVMDKVNVPDLIRELLEKNEIDLNIKVRFSPKKKTE